MLLQEDMFCHEFHLVDLRVYDNCKKVMAGCEHVFNLAADMGGMGFIQSNHSVIMYNNTMISFNMLEAARVLEIKRYNSMSAYFESVCSQVTTKLNIAAANAQFVAGSSMLQALASTPRGDSLRLKLRVEG